MPSASTCTQSPASCGAAGNGHDCEGRDLPPEWITPLRDGGFYGWPLAYAYQVWTDFSIDAYRRAIFPLTAADSLLVASMERPAVLVPAHLAPMGLHFYKHDQFPPQYKHAAFVAFRAGVLGNDLGYKVMALFAEPDGTASPIFSPASVPTSTAIPSGERRSG